MAALFISMKIFCIFLILSAGTSLCGQQVDSADPVVLQAGEFRLTKSQYEKLLPGFDRSSGAVTTGATGQSELTGHDVARLLALVTEAKRRKLEEDPVVEAQIRVRGYVLLANELLTSIRNEVKKDEAGTRALYESQSNRYVEVKARQILVRYQGVKMPAFGAVAATRNEEQAKARAVAIYEKLRAGADFAVMAAAESDDETTRTKGGELDYFARGARTSAFEKVAFDLPVGGLSQPFRTEFGYHVVQVTDHRPFPFEKVRALLEDQRARERFEEIGRGGVKLDSKYFKP